MTEEEIWAAKAARVKSLNSEADDFAVAICELEGGDAEIEGTRQREEVFQFVWHLERYNREARRRALTDPITTL